MALFMNGSAHLAVDENADTVLYQNQQLLFITKK